ncbi:MAG TPA: hypothetical protein VGI30_01555 [Caulobacteraceae bacterium]|jgi:hypothetical protein
MSENAKVVQAFGMAGIEFKGLAVESLGLDESTRLMALSGGGEQGWDAS